MSGVSTFCLVIEEYLKGDKSLTKCCQMYGTTYKEQLKYFRDKVGIYSPFFRTTSMFSRLGGLSFLKGYGTRKELRDKLDEEIKNWKNELNKLCAAKKAWCSSRPGRYLYSPTLFIQNDKDAAAITLRISILEEINNIVKTCRYYSSPNIYRHDQKSKEVYRDFYINLTNK